MPLTIRLIGDPTLHTAYSLMNRQWRSLFHAAGCMLIEDDDQHADVTIHHDYSQLFTDVRRPAHTDRFIVMRTWDFGPYPAEWIEHIRGCADELWVNTTWVKEQAIRAGLSAEQVRVVPHGIDTDLFRPGAPELPLPTDKSFRFLFVGAAVIRKGVDVLLKAYQQAFDAGDDVALIIKDHTSDVFYNEQSLRDQIVDIGQQTNAPEIVYLDDYLPVDQLAALYRTCDAGVFPYRAEGFGIPIIETMSSGLPCIVPAFGASRDFCSAETSYLVPVRRIWLPVTRELAYNTLGFSVEVSEVDFCEISVDVLADAMRRVYEADTAERAAKGRAGRQVIETRFSESTLSATLMLLVTQGTS